MNLEVLDPPAPRATTPLPSPASPPTTTRRRRASRQDDQQVIGEAFQPERLTWKNADPTVLLWIGGMHVGALAAPFFFSWWAVGVCVLLHWLTCSIGICLGYHRYLSHRSFKLKSPAEFGTLLCGMLSGEGTPRKWAAVHRMHHQLSDHEGDPHSPLDGRWWSHLFWMMKRHSDDADERLFRRYCPELADRPMMKFFDRTFGLWLIGSGVVLGVAGYFLAGWFGAASFVLWALCARMVFAYHSTWLVNSATHLWGYRNYDTRDQSRNLWWVAVLAYGEGWHNNHHAHPSIAPAGHRWWELDPTWWAIRTLRAVGLAYDVKDRLPERRNRSAADDENAEPAAAA